MTNTNPTTPADIARTLKKAGWTIQPNHNWKSGAGNVHNWQTAYYLHKQGESTAPFIVVPDNRELHKSKKPGLGNPATKQVEPIKKQPHNALPPNKVREVLRIAKQGLSLTETAKKAGIARSTLSKLLKKQNEPA